MKALLIGGAHDGEVWDVVGDAKHLVLPSRAEATPWVTTSGRASSSLRRSHYVADPRLSPAAPDLDAVVMRLWSER